MVSAGRKKEKNSKVGVTYNPVATAAVYLRTLPTHTHTRLPDRYLGLHKVSVDTDKAGAVVLLLQCALDGLRDGLTRESKDPKSFVMYGKS